MGVDGPSNGGSRNSGGGEIGGDSATTETILDLRWPVDATLTSAAADPTVPATPSENGSENDDDVGNGHEETKLEEGTKDEGVEGSGESAGGAMLSLRTYVSRRQAGSAATTGDAAQAEEKKAQELRKTALLGPVLNDGERCARVRVCPCVYLCNTDCRRHDASIGVCRLNTTGKRFRVSERNSFFDSSGERLISTVFFSEGLHQPEG